MRDILTNLDTWQQQGEKIAVATVMSTWGSAPRQVGSKMAVTLRGHITGSVSAGCVEGAVIEESMAVIESGMPRVLTYGVEDEEAFGLGLACGGTIEIFVEPFTAFKPVYALLKEQLEARQPMGIASVLDGPSECTNRKLAVFVDGHTDGDLVLPGRHDEIVKIVVDMMPREIGGIVEINGMSLFVDIYPRVPRMIIIGAVHIAEILAPMAHLAGFEVHIIDPRSAFATRERFPHAASITREWPDKALASMDIDDASCVVVLTHDPKLDDPALQVALTSDARYVGALGSKRTNRLRLERLAKAGLGKTQLARLHAPIGLPLGSRGPAGIAISIMAEIIQVKSSTPAV